MGQGGLLLHQDTQASLLQELSVLGRRGEGEGGVTVQAEGAYIVWKNLVEKT